jgi:hypothetical protein
MVRNGDGVRVPKNQYGVCKTDPVFTEILACLFRVPDNRHFWSVHLYVPQVKKTLLRLTLRVKVDFRDFPPPKKL